LPGDLLDVSVRLRLAGGFALEVAFGAPRGVTVLFGPSGSGKSTTLAAIAGLLRPASGRVVLGRDVWFDSESGIDVSVHLRHIAFVFQSLALFPHMTAAQNVEYGMHGTAARRSERRERSVALLARMRVAHLADRKPATFSGGEAQRVAIARALATRPRLVLLDEPFSALDRALREDLITDLRESLRELDTPALLVTHQLLEARSLGERLVVLDRGRVAHVGRVEDLPSSAESTP
jgi:molybdate transport system ATP-binding protein